MNTNELVSFKVAKLAKEKGFHEECYAAYSTWRGNLRKSHKTNPEKALRFDKTDVQDPYCNPPYVVVKKFNNYSKHHIAAPFHQQLQTWLRKEKGIFMWVNMMTLSSSFGWAYNIIKYENGKLITNIKDEASSVDLSFEEAFDEGLYESLKLL